MSSSTKPVVNRWSTDVFSNPIVPSYIPPEALLHDRGEFAKAFAARALLHDINRLDESKQAAVFFAHKEITPEYDASGTRNNTPDDLLKLRKRQVVETMASMLKRHREEVLGQSGGNGRDIVQKRFFRKEELDLYGALLGARGKVHQELEKETGCKLVLAGRGITSLLTETSPDAQRMAQEDPHIRITAPNERALQLAYEKVDWILSDEPSAQQYREKNRRRMDHIEGRETRWEGPAGRGGRGSGAGASSGRGSGTAPAFNDSGKRARDEEQAPDDVDDFYKNL